MSNIGLYAMFLLALKVSDIGLYAVLLLPLKVSNRGLYAVLLLALKAIRLPACCAHDFKHFSLQI